MVKFVAKTLGFASEDQVSEAPQLALDTPPQLWTKLGEMVKTISLIIVGVFIFLKVRKK